MRTLRILMMCIAWLGFTVPAMAADPAFVSCAKLAREATTVNLCVRATTQEAADQITSQIPESVQVGVTGMPESLGPAHAGGCDEAQTVCAYVTGESSRVRESAIQEALAIAAKATTLESKTQDKTLATTNEPTPTIAPETMAALQKMEALIQKVAKETSTANARAIAEKRRAEEAEQKRLKAEAETAIAQGVANAKAIENDDLKSSNSKKDQQLGEATLAMQALGAQNQRLEKILTWAVVGFGVTIFLVSLLIATTMRKQKKMSRAVAEIEARMAEFLETIQEAATNGSADSNGIREDIQSLIPRLHGMVAAQLSPLTLALEEVRKRLVEVESNTAPLSLPPLPPLAVAEAKPLPNDPDLEEEGLPYLIEPPQGGSNGNGNGKCDLDGTLDLRGVATLVSGA